VAELRHQALVKLGERLYWHLPALRSIPLRFPRPRAFEAPVNRHPFQASD
jgi:hypothetical protein